MQLTTPIRILLTLLVLLTLSLNTTRSAHSLRNLAVPPLQVICRVGLLLTPDAFHIPSVPLTLIVLGLMLFITVYFLPDDKP